MMCINSLFIQYQNCELLNYTFKSYYTSIFWEKKKPNLNIPNISVQAKGNVGPTKTAHLFPPWLWHSSREECSQGMESCQGCLAGSAIRYTAASLHQWVVLILFLASLHKEKREEKKLIFFNHDSLNISGREDHDFLWTRRGRPR